MGMVSLHTENANIILHMHVILWRVRFYVEYPCLPRKIVEHNLMSLLYNFFLDFFFSWYSKWNENRKK